MDGVHDLGGREGFTSIEVESGDAENFPRSWHGRVFGMNNCLFRSGITHNVDYFRHAIERMEPVGYLTHGYYGRWLAAIETMLIERGVLGKSEIDARCPGVGSAARPAAQPAQFDYALHSYGARRETQQPPQFAPGDRVVTKLHGQPGHTRLPAYVRGKIGEVVAVHGGWVYPDRNAHGGGDAAEYLYTVEFTAAGLWGPTAEAEDDAVCIDLFEPYLGAATDADEQSNSGVDQKA